MASNYQTIFLHHLLLAFAILLSNNQLGDGCFTHIFSFGDSHTDTGNKLQALGDKYHYMRYLPYGETYFGHPTGRFSDGRIIVDFLGESIQCT
ncbi:hypothetical protein LUZ60_016383 [Juncus effusus]|nr:hypothetical protein LUZ60_016383 [Juncus effusus]